MRRTSLVLAALLAVAGVCVMLWPMFTGHRLQADTNAAVQEFLNERNEPEQQYSELLAALQKYNRQLYTEKQCNLVDLEACEEPAADLTAYGIDDEIIGVLEIPAMELTMPVYLGASDAHLAAGAAVLGNTSAPIGGDNTNCVIAGHRGWRGADYFRHIDRLTVGDTVKLTNLWETLTYTVSDIQIIQPHEVEKIKIQQGRDLLTLLTCHPSDKRIIQQEVDDADIENAVIVIPTLADVMTHDDLRERIAGQRERLIFSDCLFLCPQCVGGLNIGLLTAGGRNEVNFPCDRSDLSFGIFLIAIDDADVNGAFTDHQLIENDVLHDVRHFLLAEADTGIPQSNVLTVVFVGIVKIALALDIPAFAFGEEEGIR